MIEFNDKDILKIGIIYKHVLYTSTSDLFHLNLIEKVVNYKFISSDMFYDFITSAEILFLYYFNNNILVVANNFDCKNYKIINELQKVNIEYSQLYKKLNFDTSINDSTFSKINMQKIDGGV